MSIKVKAKLKKGKLKAKVKYPLIGEAELELGSISKLKGLVKIPFLSKARFSGTLKLNKEKELNKIETRSKNILRKGLEKLRLAALKALEDKRFKRNKLTKTE